MDTYQFCYPDGTKATYKVFDKMHLFRLMFQIEPDFTDILKYDPVVNQWVEGSNQVAKNDESNVVHLWEKNIEILYDHGYSIDITDVEGDIGDSVDKVDIYNDMHEYIGQIDNLQDLQRFVNGIRSLE